MGLNSVMQLQAMNEMMKWQIAAYHALSALMLGVAGGNWSEHIHKCRFKKIYGVDINSSHLKETERRFVDLYCLKCLHINFIDDPEKLPKANMIIANL